MKTDALDPNMLGFWAKCVREAQHMSQEALAAAASVDIRTVQRFEAGKAVNITSRRALARALGYENQDAFDDPEFVSGVLRFFEKLRSFNQKGTDDQHPDHERIDVRPMISGTQAFQFADDINAVLFDVNEALNDETKELAAGFCDYVQELMDLDEISVRSRLGFARELDGMLKELGQRAASVYWGSRNLESPWGEQAPMNLLAGYLVVVPADQKLDQLYVPRRVRLA